jgi:hypothetical protein
MCKTLEESFLRGGGLMSCALNRRTSPDHYQACCGLLFRSTFSIASMVSAVMVSTVCADTWQSSWQDPPVEFRPLQITHGLTPEQATHESLAKWKELGMGGIVCNVPFAEYMRSEAKWKTLVDAIERCAKLGLVVWIYDEDGYPSGAAGGLVLEGHPQFEAMALAYDAQREDPFIVRPAYEHTHASNNYYMARRYPNLIDEGAVARFVKVTHEAYRDRVGRHFGKAIVAFFTDEPSLMALNIGQIPEDARKKVPVTDKIDESVTPLPMVPWVDDLPEQYRKRYGEDLVPLRRSLFVGDSDRDRQTRCRFYGLIADLMVERYFGSLQKWCRANGVASGGHLLREETIVNHPALYGNALKCFSRLDIPGMDMLSSRPGAVYRDVWPVAVFPASAARLNDQRKVMTEVSDFLEKMAGKPPATLEAMCATAAWQAALGVTEFTLYYKTKDRSAEDYRTYSTFIGRLNAILRDATPDPDALVYYPIYDMWSEYLPVAGKLTIDAQSPRANTIENSFMAIGNSLLKGNVPFVLIDHEYLEKARVSGRRLLIANHAYSALVLPDEVRLPKGAADVISRFRVAEGRILRSDQLNQLAPVARLEPAAEGILLARFVRDGKRIILALNTTMKSYTGKLSTDALAKWLMCDPMMGSIALFDSSQNQLHLAPMQTLLLAEK